MVTTDEGRITSIRIEDEMRQSYLDYAMSVIVSRALPDVRDGLKPVQRRILYAMSDMNLAANQAYKKSARIVGDVLGKYHPQGDGPVYEAMVRMAQDFSLRYPLVDGQGNFGSVDNDPPAAMRYTEARLSPIAAEMLADIDKNTVDFVDNYDSSLREPTVLPARLPNMLINGASGIAVAMATNIPPHNLGEICDAIAHLLEHPDATADDLIKLVPGPDFPTAASILGRDGIRSMQATGRGRIRLRARTTVEESRNNRLQIIVTELPYQVNKAALVEKIADLVKAKKIEGISDLRDESDRDGMRIVIEIGRNAQPGQVLNALFKHTPMQSTFAANMVALHNGQPMTMGLKEALEHHIDFRREVIRRRTEFDLEKARERAHILEGLVKALSLLDQVIRAIRAAESAEKARDALQAAPFDLSERQAQAVLDMQLRRLAQLERQKIEDEYGELQKKIAELVDLLANPGKIDLLIRDDAAELKKKYGDPRRTVIEDQEADDFTVEDLIPHQEVLVTLSTRGYIKRQPLETYRRQGRGGRGITGMVTREADAVYRLLVADTHDYMLFFTDRGRVFSLRIHEIPDASRMARGIPLINLISIEQGERVTAVVGSPPSFEGDVMLMATREGEIKKTALREFAQVRSAGIIAMNIEPGDELVAACRAQETHHVLMITAKGQAIRFPVTSLRLASRGSGGVRGVRLAASGDAVTGVLAVPPASPQQVLAITELGYGKRTDLGDYPLKGRGGQGVITYKVSDHTGPVAGARLVDGTEELVLISTGGIVIRTGVDSIARQGRATQGVTVMRTEPNDSVASIAVIELPAGSPTGPQPEPEPDPEPEGDRPGRVRTSLADAARRAKKDKS